MKLAMLLISVLCLATAVEARPDRGDSCFTQYQACSCVPHPSGDCGWCPKGRISFEIQTCFNRTAAPTFCRKQVTVASKHTLNAPTAVSPLSPPCEASKNTSRTMTHFADSVEHCETLPCGAGELRASGLRCSVPLRPWLRRDPRRPGSEYNFSSFPRMDIMLKVVVAEAWMRNETKLDAQYDAFAQRRTGRRDFLLRRQIFRGLFESARAEGLDWAHGAIQVTDDWTIVDGAHRTAIALLLGYDRVVLQRRRCGVVEKKCQFCARSDNGPRAMVIGNLQKWASAELVYRTRRAAKSGLFGARAAARHAAGHSR